MLMVLYFSLELNMIFFSEVVFTNIRSRDSTEKLRSDINLRISEYLTGHKFQVTTI